MRLVILILNGCPITVAFYHTRLSLINIDLDQKGVELKNVHLV